MVILIPSPREPKNVDPYLEPLLQDLLKFGPKGEGPSFSSIILGSSEKQRVNRGSSHMGALISGGSMLTAAKAIPAHYRDHMQSH